VNGEETLIMSRPVDGEDFVYLDFSPRRVVFSGWIGDNDPTCQSSSASLFFQRLNFCLSFLSSGDGLTDAMKKLLQSVFLSVLCLLLFHSFFLIWF
jgi:hypothetical protein